MIKLKIIFSDHNFSRLRVFVTVHAHETTEKLEALLTNTIAPKFSEIMGLGLVLKAISVFEYIDDWLNLLEVKRMPITIHEDLNTLSALDKSLGTP